MLQKPDFADWAPKERISSAFDRLNERMLAAYNRCGGGPNEIDNDEDEPSKGKKLAGFQKRLPLYELNSVSLTSLLVLKKVASRQSNSASKIRRTRCLCSQNELLLSYKSL